MFRMGLLASTAMTAVALLLSGAGAAQVETGMHSASRDPNTRFLCTYGGFSVTDWWASWSGESHWQSTHVAVPITGHGETVSRIRVIEAPGSPSRPDFSIGIYSDNSRGFPGNPIVVGTGKVGPSCGPVKVSIAPTKLNRNTRYWIVEGIQATLSGYRASVYWMINPNTKRRAYSRYISDSGTTGPWSGPFSSGPYLTLK